MPRDSPPGVWNSGRKPAEKEGGVCVQMMFSNTMLPGSPGRPRTTKPELASSKTLHRGPGTYCASSSGESCPQHPIIVKFEVSAANVITVPVGNTMGSKKVLRHRSTRPPSSSGRAEKNSLYVDTHVEEHSGLENPRLVLLPRRAAVAVVVEVPTTAARLMLCVGDKLCTTWA